MDINAVFAGLAARADTITGLRGHAFVPDSITPPTFVPMDVEVDYDRAFARGLDELTVRCLVLVSRATDKQGQAKTLQYLNGGGVRSLYAAVREDRTLGGACDDAHVTRSHGPQQFEFGTSVFYGVEVWVRIIGSGD